MKLTAIIVNYATADFALGAAESVLANQPDACECHIHIVDNDSPGDDAAVLRAGIEARGWGARVTLWPETTNHGFGGGNNVVLSVLAEASAVEAQDYVLLLNPDAALLPGALDPLLQVLNDTPDAAAVGPALIDGEGNPAVAAFRFPTFLSELIRIADIYALKRAFPRHTVAFPAKLEQQDVDWVSGAAVMFRLKALKAVDLFDPGFFLYYEEVDLMRRLKAAGWRVLHVPDAKVQHHVGASTGVRRDGPRQRKPAYVYASWRRYFRRSLGQVPALTLATLLLATSPLSLIVSAIRGRQSSLPKNFAQDHTRYALWPLTRPEKEP